MRWVKSLLAKRYKKRQQQVLSQIAMIIEERPKETPSQKTNPQPNPHLHASRLP